MNVQSDGADSVQGFKTTENRVSRLLDAVVGVATAAVAFTDWEIIANISLGYLYVLPIALCALINTLPFTLGLSVLCTALQDLFGPPAESLQWRMVRDLIYLTSFLIVGFCVSLIARQRNRMAEEVSGNVMSTNRILRWLPRCNARFCRSRSPFRESRSRPPCKPHECLAAITTTSSRPVKTWWTL